jgi:glucose/arabinose dehydrogenase
VKGAGTVWAWLSFLNLTVRYVEITNKWCWENTIPPVLSMLSHLA